MQQRTCPFCGSGFTPTHWNQRFCPPTEEDRAKKAKPISRCARLWETARYQATVTETVACKYCGQGFTRPRSPGRKVYCSDPCHHAAKRKRNLDPRAPRSRCRGGLNLHPRPAPNPIGEDVEGYVDSMLHDPCAYCGEPSVHVDHIVPRQADGADDWTNFTGACKRCNSRKTFTPLLLFLGWDKAQREFEPWRAAVGAVHREFRDARLAA